jgi:hypothetical protein
MKRIYKWTIGATSALAITAASVTPAQALLGLPSIVFDPKAIVQTTALVAKASAQIAQLTKLYSSAVQQVNSLTSHSGFGVLLNGVLEKDLRRFTPTSWNDTMDVLTTSVPASVGNLKSAYGSLKSAYNITNGAALFPTDTRLAGIHDRDVKTALAAASVATGAYDQTTDRATRVESLMAKIDTSTDVKAAADLQNRIQGENVTAINDLIRVLAAQTQVAAAQQQVQNLDREFNGSFGEFTNRAPL